MSPIATAPPQHAGRNGGNARPWEGYGRLDRSVPIEGQPYWEVSVHSPIAYLDGWPRTRQMSEADIGQTIEAFALVARRAEAVGFDVIELDCAHGYLLHQILSHETNRRADGWGGSATVRMRLPLGVARAVRRRWPVHKPLFVRIYVTDEAGWTLDDLAGFTRGLKACGVDLIDCSSGGLRGRWPTAAGTPGPMGYQVPYAERVRRQADMATMADGLIMEAEHADSFIAHGQADLFAIGREMLLNSFWPVQAAVRLGVDPHYELMPPNHPVVARPARARGLVACREPGHAH